MDSILDNLGQSIRTALPGAVTGHEVKYGELTITGKASEIVRIATYLRDDPACQFVSIIDVSAVDWPSREQRFDDCGTEPAARSRHQNFLHGRPSLAVFSAAAALHRWAGS